MKREVTGHYVPLPSAAGENAHAFIPNPMPPLELGAAIQRLNERVLEKRRQDMNCAML